jgi:hypothetical protein
MPCFPDFYTNQEFIYRGLTRRSLRLRTTLTERVF